MKQQRNFPNYRFNFHPLNIPFSASTPLIFGIIGVILTLLLFSGCATQVGITFNETGVTYGGLPSHLEINKRFADQGKDSVKVTEISNAFLVLERHNGLKKIIPVNKHFPFWIDPIDLESGDYTLQLIVHINRYDELKGVYRGIEAEVIETQTYQFVSR